VNITGLTVFDSVAPNGTQACFWYPGGSISPNFYAGSNPINCTGKLFTSRGGPVDCVRFTGDLYLVFAGKDVGTMMRMGEGLEKLGLNNLTFINGTLYIINLFTNVTITTTPFLPKLTAAKGVFVLDYNTLQEGLPYFFQSLPLQSLRLASTLVVANTGLPNMTSFSGLRCVDVMAVSNNPALQSLAGLENLNFIDRSNVFVNGSFAMILNPLLDRPAKFRPLSLAAGCGSKSLPNLINITVSSCPTSITSFPQLCSYIAGSAACS
jgi:hypothetical protein